LFRQASSDLSAGDMQQAKVKAAAGMSVMGAFETRFF